MDQSNVFVSSIPEIIPPTPDASSAPKTAEIFNERVTEKNITAPSEETDGDSSTLPGVEKGIRTKRPVENSDGSITECRLTYFGNRNVVETHDAKRRHFKQPKESAYSHNIANNGQRSLPKTTESALQLIEDFFDIAWTKRNIFTKTLIAIWFSVTTLFVIKIFVDFIHVHFFVPFDDCVVARSICYRLDVACFSKCRITRWDVLMHKIFGSNYEK